MRQTLFWIGFAVVALAAYVCIRLANVFDPRILVSFVAAVPALLLVMLTSTRRIGENEFLVVSGKGDTMVLAQSGWPLVPPLGEIRRFRKPPEQRLALERQDAFDVADGSKLLLTGPIRVSLGSLPRQLLAFADLQKSEGSEQLADNALATRAVKQLRSSLRELPTGKTSLRDVRLRVENCIERLAFADGIVADIDVRNVELQAAS